MTAPVPSVTKGRGAWTKTGKDNGTNLYALVPNLPKDGSAPTKDVNYQAVNLAVMAIQKRLNEVLVTSVPLKADGLFGPATEIRVGMAQEKLGLTKTLKVSAYMCRMLFYPVAMEYAAYNGVEGKYIWGQVLQESMADPGAVGYTTPSDRGLVQINLAAHPDITAAQAFDVRYALNYSCERFADAWRQYSSKTKELQINCSIAQHNSPVSARKWFNSGVPPNTTIQTYVNNVLKYSTWKP